MNRSYPLSHRSPLSTAAVPTDKRVLLVGVGGLGCATLAALAPTLGARWILVDDDVVDETNLHRQVLFSDADVGRPKLEAARDALIGRGVAPDCIELRSGRVLPENARQWLGEVDLVVEGADNYATKFLVADACHLEGKPVVHGAAVGWNATVLAVPFGGKPCYRCLFEDVPPGPAANCDSLGVVGPVVGVAGALMADLALALLGHPPPHVPGGPVTAPNIGGVVHVLEGKTGRLRAVSVRARANCPLCGPRASVHSLDWDLYQGPSCSPKP